jgi:hypothetical protein
MRKKKILFIAAVALAAAACSKTYNVGPDTQKAIGFSTWAETLTKAEARVQGSNEFKAGDTFKVSGIKTTGSTDAKVFDNVVVTASGSSSLSWAYSPIRFWDTQANSYTFYAISPSAAGTVAYADGEVSATDVVFAGDDNDILVANKMVLTSSSTPKIGETVDLVFNHVASLVDIKVKKAHVLESATVKVSAFALNNIKSKGDLAVSAYDATTGVPTADWTPEGTTATYGPASGVEEVDITSPIVIEDDTNFVPTYGNTPAASTDIVKSLVVMPQTFAASAQQIAISYSIAVTGGDTINYTATLDLADFDIVDDKDQNDTKVQKWEAGKHYTFYITLDANAIEFSASITPWTSASAGYHYVIK